VKKLDTFKGFQELNSKKLREVEGGSWIGDAWRWLKKHAYVRPTTIPIYDQITGQPIGGGTAYGGETGASW